MEELQATQEEMYQKENGYLQQIEEMESLLKTAGEIQIAEKELQDKIANLEGKLQELNDREQVYLKQIEALNTSLGEKTDKRVTDLQSIDSATVI